MPIINGVGTRGRRSGPQAYTISATTQVVNGLNKGMNVLEATQNVAKNFAVLMRDTATGLGAVITPAQAASLSVQIKKGGVTAYVTVTPVITVVGFTGLIDIAFTGLHLNTLGLMAVNVTGIGLLPNDDLFIDVVATNKNDAVRGGLSSLPNSAIGTQAGLPTKQNLDDANTAVNAHTDTATAASSAAVNTHTDTATAATTTAVNTHTDTVTSAAVASVNAHTDTAISGLPSPTDILDALLVDHASIGSVGDAIAVAAGLLQGNFFMDTVVNGDNGQASARLRLWRDEGGAGAATSGGAGEGEFATFQVTTTYTAPGKVATHRVVRLVGT